MNGIFETPNELTLPWEWSDILLDGQHSSFDRLSQRYSHQRSLDEGGIPSNI